MGSNQPKSTLEDEKLDIEQKMNEVQGKIAEIFCQTENYLRQKIELEIKLNKINEKLIRVAAKPSVKSVAFSSQLSTKSDAHLCTSIDECNECQKLHRLKPQTVATYHQSIISDPTSKNSINADSCQSMGQCSMCRKLHFKRNTSCSSFRSCSNCQEQEVELKNVTVKESNAELISAGTSVEEMAKKVSKIDFQCHKNLNFTKLISQIFLRHNL